MDAETDRLLRDRLSRLEEKVEHKPGHKDVSIAQKEVREHSEQMMDRLAERIYAQIEQQGRDNITAIENAFALSKDANTRLIIQHIKEYRDEEADRAKKANSERAQWWQIAIGVGSLIWFMLSGDADGAGVLSDFGSFGG